MSNTNPRQILFGSHHSVFILYCFQECWQDEFGVYKDSFRNISAKTREVMTSLPMANEEIVVENIPFWEFDAGDMSIELHNVISKNDSPHVVLSCI